jgi:MbtH protein
MSDCAGSYLVVINHEDQYSIWPQEKDVPGGWCSTGFVGSRSACLDEIARIWTDMRPRSLREEMETRAAHDRAGTLPGSHS